MQLFPVRIITNIYHQWQDEGIECVGIHSQ